MGALVPGTSDIAKTDAVCLKIVHEFTRGIPVFPGIGFYGVSPFDPGTDGRPFTESHGDIDLHILKFCLIDMVINGVLIMNHDGTPP